LFEDVGFFDSFRPLWGWHETKEDLKRKKQEKKAKKAQKKLAAVGGAPEPAATEVAQAAPISNGTAVTTGTEASAGNSAVAKRHAAPTVEEVDED
jgi:translocation protein SEC62